MIERFLRWLLRPALDAIQNLGHENTEQWVDSLERYDRLMKYSLLIRNDIEQLPHYGDHLNGMAISLSELRHAIHDMRLETPHLTLGTLMAWEAIAYASDKYDKDTEQHGVTNRVSEILAWASAYMHENEWAVPATDVLTTLLGMRDQITMIRTCGKYS